MMHTFLKSKHNHKLTEGILWDHKSKLLLFVDILSNKLFRMDVDTLEIVDEHNFEEKIGWVQLTNKKGIYILGMKSGIAVYDYKKSSFNYLNQNYPKNNNQRLNDSYVDSTGSVWFGTMADDFERPNIGILASYSHSDKNPVVHDYDYGITNGPLIDEKNNILYHTDSKKGVIYKFSFDPNKRKIFDKSTFVNFDKITGVPDGMCFDEHYQIFVALWGQGCIKKFSNEGREIKTFSIPEYFATNVCFAGKNLDRLFVTAAAGDMDDNLKKNCGFIYEIKNHNSKGFKANEFHLQ